jgi:putative membrane protein
VPAEPPLAALALRGSLGGALMGLANLVPGISGGTMLLAAGVYPRFIEAIADVTMLRLRPRSLILLGVVAGSAAAAILLLAGATRTLVVEQRWVMYSLFIGLTLGGVPIVWRLARPAAPGVWIGAALGLAGMVAMTFTSPPGDGADGRTLLLVLAGTAGAAAMILPGVSGGYLLLLLGQYLPILGAIDLLKQALLGGDDGGGIDFGLLGQALTVVVPVGIGVALGIVGVSNLLRWTLERFPKATLGVLLGLLVGAVVGLWPFQQGVPPEAGDVFKGRTLGVAEAAAVDPEDWPLEAYAPSPGQALASVGLILLGLGITLGIDRVGGHAGEGSLHRQHRPGAAPPAS